jgi:transcriptional regulator with XRE-family HTH domain
MTQTETQWAADWSLRIGQRIAEYRRRARITADQLAARTKQLGYEVTRSSIANIESGRRDVVTVQQITVIAMALDTSPVLLLFDPTQPETQLLPDDTVSGIEASEWWSGNLRYVHGIPGADQQPNRRIGDLDFDLTSQRKVFQLFRALQKSVDDLRKLDVAAKVKSARPTFGLEHEIAKQQVALAANYLVGAVGGHKEWLPADAVELLEHLESRNLFTWPLDMIQAWRNEAGPMQPWPGEET